MRVLVTRTPEIFDAPVNGKLIPCQVWYGMTDLGTKIELYVITIQPDEPVPLRELEPTPEMFDHVGVPLRIWKGHDNKGAEIVAHVLSIVPYEDGVSLEDEVPDFMRRSRDTFNVQT